MAPAEAEAHLLAGWSNYELGRWEKGVAHARVAAAAAPTHAPAWNHLAAGLRMLGREAQARDAAQRALAIDARLAAGWSTLGIVERDAGRLEDARARFRKAPETEPAFAPPPRTPA